MHRTIGYISKRVAHIRTGEGRKVGLTFLYFFLVITAYYVIKPVSRALVLDDLGHRVVPYADLICAIIMGPIVTLFARSVDRISKPRLVSLSFLTVIAATILFWRLLSWPYPWIAGVFYIWVGVFSVLVVTLFWLVANDLYRPRDAKRLFGFIGSGGILGGIVGSSIAAVGAQVIGTENLLLLSAALLALCWLVVRQLWQYVPDQTDTERGTLATPRRDTFFSNFRGFLGSLSQSRYLLLLVVIVCINKIIATFVFYQFNPFIEQTFPGVDAKTTFTGIFFGGINVLAFIVQFFFTSWILRRWGLLWALLILPVGMLFGASAFLVLPIFWVAAGTELYDRSLNYSLHNTAKEVLYLPIDRSIRYKVKPFIDMVVFRFGKGIAAVLGIVLLDVLGMPVRYLSLLTIPLLVVWVVAAIQMRKEYTKRIRTLVQARSGLGEAADQPPADKPEGNLATVLQSLTASRSPQAKLSIAKRLVDGELESPHARDLLDHLRQYEDILAKAPKAARNFEVSQLKQMAQDQTSPMAVRREAIQILGRQRSQDALDFLGGMLIVEQEAVLSHEVALTLVKMRAGADGLQFPVAQIRRQVAREVADYQRTAHMVRIYRRHHPGPPAANDPVIGLLRLLTEESIEQIFRLLVLIHRPADICLVYEQLRVPDTHVRADAIELLDNLVDPAMRSTIFPILDEDRFLSFLDEAPGPGDETIAIHSLFQEVVSDHHPWLSVTALCAVGRLRLTALRQELEHASRHAAPLVSTAAKLALQFSTQP